MEERLSGREQQPITRRICKIIEGEPKQVDQDRVFNLKMSTRETEPGCRERGPPPQAIVPEVPKLR